MPIQQSAGSISDLIGQRKKTTDTITSILNKETSPGYGDIGRAASQTMMAINDPRLFKPTTAQEAFQGRRDAELAPQLAIQGIQDAGIKSGESEAKSIMDSFGQFADNPEDLAKLVTAAHEDPEPINAANAATFAARKASELGLRSAKKMQAQAQLNYSLNKGKAKTKEVNAPAWLDSEQRTSTGETSVPLDSPQLINAGPSDTILMPPPVANETQGDIGLDGGSTPTTAVAIPKIADVNGVSVDLNKVPGLVASARDYGDRASIRKAGETILLKDKGVHDLLEAADGSSAVLAKMDNAEAALNNILAKGGTTGLMQNQIGTLLNNPDFEILNSVKAASAMLQRVPGTGAVSDFDAKNLLKQVAGGDLSPSANRLLLATTKAQAENARQFGEFYRWYIPAGGTTSGAQEAWAQFRKENKMVGRNGKGEPVLLPGYETNWKDYFSGKAAPKTVPAAAQSDDIDAQIEALKKELGQ